MDRTPITSGMFGVLMIILVLSRSSIQREIFDKNINISRFLPPYIFYILSSPILLLSSGFPIDQTARWHVESACQLLSGIAIYRVTDHLP